jgi:hypothetical protein
MSGLVVDGTGIEVVAGGERIGPRRLAGPDDVALLTGLAARYVQAVQAGSDDGVFIGLGRELYGWLDGARGTSDRAAGAG